MKRAFEVVRGKDPASIQLPKRATAYSAGYDFFVSETREIPARGTALLPTGVKAKMPQGEVLLLFIRSSLGIKRGLSLANGVGVIDADYYGNPSYYSVMPESIFDALELASLRGEKTTTVNKVLFETMVIDYKEKISCKNLIRDMRL